MSMLSGQIIIVGTAVSEGFDPRVAKGARCAMLCVYDCETLFDLGHIESYEIDEGFDAGRMLDETLGQHGWTDIKIRACLPVAEKVDGWEPELAALITTARKLGVAHMVFEPDCHAPPMLH